MSAIQGVRQILQPPKGPELPIKEPIKLQGHSLAGGRGSCPGVSRSGQGMQGRNSALPQWLGEEWSRPGETHALHPWNRALKTC